MRSAPSATGRQLQESQKGLACPKASLNRSRHRSAAPRRAEGHCTGARQSAFFSSTGRGAFSFWARPKGAPAAPRAVGRGGARERAQFSPQAETELSGLCDDDNGGRIPVRTAPLRKQNPPWPTFGGPHASRGVSYKIWLILPASPPPGGSMPPGHLPRRIPCGAAHW